MCDSMCLDCKNELMLCKLCAKKAKIHHLCAGKIIADKECINELDAHMINVEQEVANNICVSGKLSASNVAALNLNANNLCSQNGTINNLCVNNLNAVNIVGGGQKYRAAVTFSADSNYILGQPINWNVVLDDPNNNVLLSPVFGYTVPVAGYYLITFDLDQINVVSNSTLGGVPVGVLQLLVNGSKLRINNAPFLSFSNQQDATLSGISLLNAGDVITMNYNIAYVDSVLGLTNLIGSVTIEGNGSFAGESGFAIHLLSAMNSGGSTPIVCAPCPAVTVGCQNINIDCSNIMAARSNNSVMDDCDSCQ